MTVTMLIKTLLLILTRDNNYQLFLLFSTVDNDKNACRWYVFIKFTTFHFQQLKVCTLQRENHQNYITLKELYRLNFIISSFTLTQVIFIDTNRLGATFIAQHAGILIEDIFDVS